MIYDQPIAAGEVGLSRVIQNGLFGVLFAIGALSLTSCATNKPEVAQTPRPDFSPTTKTTESASLRLDATQVEPMYTELVAIDLASVVDVALASNFDILQAREEVIKLRGRLEETVGAALPAIVPTAVFEHVEGKVRATEGDLVGVGFNTFNASVAIQWVINPGRVIYAIVAAKKRLAATKDQEQAVVMETLRRATNEYYELVLTQARISAAHQGVEEATELLRISHLLTQAGVGVPADELRAEARLAEAQQDMVASLAGFYDASVSLAVTLHLDSTATLVPDIKELPPTHLVREDVDIHELLDCAMAFRPDLKRVRSLIEVAVAETDSTWWGAYGPQFAAGYQYGGITGHANNIVPNEGIPGNLIVNPTSPTGTFGSSPIANGLIKEGILRASRRGGRDDQTYSFSDQQRANAGMSFRWSLAAFGTLKAARASQRQQMIEAEQMLDQAGAQVIRAAQASKMNRQLIGLAHRQVEAAQEALRLSEANLAAGTMTTLDVLQAQEAVNRARVRYADAVVRYNQSQVNLLAALGLLDRDALMAAYTKDAPTAGDEGIQGS